MRVALALLCVGLALAAAACGSAGSATPENAPTTLVATLGDGVTAGSPGYDPDKRLRRLLGFGKDVESQWQHWAEQRHPDLAFRNCGRYGDTTAQMAARLVECTHDARAIVIQGGLADLQDGASPAAVAERLRRMIRTARTIGLDVAVADVIPWNNGWPAAAGPIRALNARIAALARAERATLLHFHAALADPARPGRMREEWTADGEYPSVAGYERLGETAFRLP
jgi:hypothetical protein